MKMPVEGLQLVLGSGVGVGFLAGACYLILSHYKWLGHRKRDATHCCICHQPFPTNLPSQGVVCCMCGRRVCRPAELENILDDTKAIVRAGSKCSRFSTTHNRWRCMECLRHQTRGADLLTDNLRLLDHDFWDPSYDGNLHRACMSAVAESEREGASAAQQHEEERQLIRELIEGRAGRLVGGDLDDVSVGRLYSHAQYERMFARHHTVLSTALAKLATSLHKANNNLPPTTVLNKSAVNDEGSISFAELGLREAVRRVAREASRLPRLSGVSSNTGDLVSPTATYEDLLATAILNKVIDTFQKDNHHILPSPPESMSSRRSSRSNSIRTNPLDDLAEYNLEEVDRHVSRRSFYRDYNLPSAVQVNPLLHDEDHFSTYSDDTHPSRRHGARRKRYTTRQPDGDNGSLSSLEDYSGGSSSSKQRDDVAFTIKQCIEEVTSSDIESYDNHMESSDFSEINPTSQHNGQSIYDYRVKSTTLRGTPDYTFEETVETEPWEENWLFQKKKSKSAIISTPVAMLVPKASIEYRAKIGDRDAEDTTDLSDAGSDYDDADLDGAPKTDLTSVLVTSRTVIGGKNDFTLKETLEEDGLNVSIEVKTMRQDMVSVYVTGEDTETKEDKPTTDIPSGDVEVAEPFEAFKVDDQARSIASKIEKWDTFYDKQATTRPLHKTCLNVDVDSSPETFTSFTSSSTQDGGVVTEAKNSTLLHDSPYSGSSSLESNHQQDGEYTEHYASIGSIGVGKKPVDETETLPKKYLSKYNYDSGIDVNDGPPQKGTIAEREHKKWENAVPMPNNPYTAENIEKRLSQRSSSIISLPQVTALERRNSYKRDQSFEVPEVLDSMNLPVSVDPPNISQNAKHHMFEQIVKDYSPKPNQWQPKYTSMINVNATESSSEKPKSPATPENVAALFSANLSKTQSCTSLNDAKRDDTSTTTEFRSGISRSVSSTPGAGSLQQVLSNVLFDKRRCSRNLFEREAKRPAEPSREILEATDPPVHATSVESLSLVAEEKRANDISGSEEDIVYKARPATVIEGRSRPTFLSLETGTDVELISLESSTSSYETLSSSAERVYNLNSGVIVYSSKSPITPPARDEVVQLSKSPASSTVRLRGPSSSPFHVSSSELSPIRSNLQNGGSNVILKMDNIDQTRTTVDDLIVFANNLPEEGEPSTPLFEKESKTDTSKSSTPESYSSIANDVEALEQTSTDLISDPADIEIFDGADSEIGNSESVVSVKERMKRFLNPKFMDYDEDNIKPNHSITARSLFRRTNSATNQVNQFISPEQSGDPKKMEFTLNSDIPIKSLKERREFFEKLNK